VFAFSAVMPLRCVDGIGRGLDEKDAHADDESYLAMQILEVAMARFV